MPDFTCGQSFSTSGNFICNLPPEDIYNGSLPVGFGQPINYGPLCGQDYRKVIFPCLAGTVSQIFVTVVTNHGVIFENIELKLYYQDNTQIIYVSEEIGYDISTANYMSTATVGAQTIVGAYNYLFDNRCPTSRGDSILGGGTVYNIFNPKHFDFRLVGNICSDLPSRMNLFYNRFNFQLAGGEPVELSDIVYLGQITFACTSSGTRSTLGARNYFGVNMCNPYLWASGIYVV